MKALIVVDMQNDFIDGALGSPEAQAVVPHVVAKMQEMAGTETFLFYTQDTHHEDYLNTQEGKFLPIPHCIENTDGWLINKEIFNVGRDFLFANNQYDVPIATKESFGNVFFGRAMAHLAEREGIDEIVMVGVCTDICVVSNALIFKALMPEVKITVDASCCAGTTPENHKAALQIMKSCQVNVINEDNECFVLRVTNKEDM